MQNPTFGKALQEYRPYNNIENKHSNTIIPAYLSQHWKIIARGRWEWLENCAGISRWPHRDTHSFMRDSWAPFLQTLLFFPKHSRPTCHPNVISIERFASAFWANIHCSASSCQSDEQIIPLRWSCHLFQLSNCCVKSPQILRRLWKTSQSNIIPRKDAFLRTSPNDDTFIGNVSCRRAKDNSL